MNTHAGFSEALEATNKALEKQGLYLSHIWGPEQQILTPSWRTSCRAVALPGAVHLSVAVLGPIDLLLTKLCRADGPDLADMKHLIASEHISEMSLEAALAQALVPVELAETFAENVPKLLALF